MKSYLLAPLLTLAVATVAHGAAAPSPPAEPRATAAPRFVDLGGAGGEDVLAPRFDASSLQSSLAEMRESMQASAASFRSSIQGSASSMRSSMQSSASEQRSSLSSSASSFMASVTASDSTTAFSPQTTAAGCKTIVDHQCCDTGVVVNGKCYVVDGHTGSFIGDTDSNNFSSSGGSIDSDTIKSGNSSSSSIESNDSNSSSSNSSISNSGTSSSSSSSSKGGSDLNSNAASQTNVVIGSGSFLVTFVGALMAVVL